MNAIVEFGVCKAVRTVPLMHLELLTRTIMARDGGFKIWTYTGPVANGRVDKKTSFQCPMVACVGEFQKFVMCRTESALEGVLSPLLWATIG